MDGIQYKALIAGGVAGLSVDVALFPLDTLKTRLQSPNGFRAAGGFSGIYKGLLSVTIGSFPGAALFFCCYESSKPMFSARFGGENSLTHMAAGATGEIFACLVRVPTENVKQKLQANLFPNTKSALEGIIRSQGLRGFYVGYGTTILREIPFSMIQFPLWEAAKRRVSAHFDRPTRAWESAACGSASGAIAAAITTPLDVVKTRLMLGVDANGVRYEKFGETFYRIVQNEGPKKLFSGIEPRVMWISIGGFVYFGAYEESRKLLGTYL